MTRDYRNVRKPGWLTGVVVSKLSPVTYEIQVELRGELIIWKRHIDQIRVNNVEDDNVGEVVRYDIGNPSVSPDLSPIVEAEVRPDQSVTRSTEEDSGGREPARTPRPEVAVSTSAAASAAVVDPVPTSTTSVPAATSVRPTRERKDPFLNKYKDYVKR